MEASFPRQALRRTNNHTYNSKTTTTAQCLYLTKHKYQPVVHRSTHNYYCWPLRDSDHTGAHRYSIRTICWQVCNKCWNNRRRRTCTCTCLSDHGGRNDLTMQLTKRGRKFGLKWEKNYFAVSQKMTPSDNWMTFDPNLLIPYMGFWSRMHVTKHC